MSDKDAYRRFCESNPGIPIFLMPWWLDAACDSGDWDVVLVQKGGTILGALPFLVSRRRGFTHLTQPKLTQFLGPWIVDRGGKASTRAAREKDILIELAQSLPPFDYYSQCWAPDIVNWTPFHWNDFSQTTRYTLRIEDLSDLDGLWTRMQQNARGDVRKATKRFHVRLREKPTVDDLLELNRLTFERQGMKVPYDNALVQRIDDACSRRNSRRIFLAEDGEGRLHAGVYLVWDSKTAYYLMGGGDPSLRNSGATTFCLWEAMKFASTVTQVFDFEGSMIEPVERFFRSFGAVHTPYYFVTRTDSLMLRIRNALIALRGPRR